MRADIDFSKFNRTQLTKGKKTLIFTLYFLLIIAMFTICAVYAYFTSSATAEGNLYFGEISVGLFDGENNLTSSVFETKFEKIVPGDTLDLSNINVKNTGTHSAYVLMNLDITITNSEEKSLHYNIWCNIYGEEVNINDFAVNVTKPNLLLKDENAFTNIKWKVPSYAVDSNFSGATAKVALSAYASQTNLEEAENYVDADLYASYYICKTATYTSESMDVLTTYNGSKVSGEPLMKIDNTEDVVSYSTMQVTRNIAKYEFTGEEKWRKGDYPAANSIQFYTDLPTGMGLVIADTKNSHFLNSYTTNGSNIGSYYNMFPSIGDYNITTVDEWKIWLANQYSKGTPVTVWYKLTSPYSINIYSNKNIYQGSQFLHYETNAEDNNINDKGIISITKGLTENYSEMELGGNIFEFLYDKEFVISYKIKFYSDNNTQELHSTMGFYVKDGNNLEYQQGIAGSNISYTENKWIYHYLKVPALSTLGLSSNINHYRLMLANYTSGDVVNFEIKDIQIEIGSCPTDYEDYDQTVYARVNGSILRTVNGVSDTYAYSYDSSIGKASGTISRNIGKIKLNGYESNMGLHSKTMTDGTRFIRLKDTNSVASTTPNSIICSHLNSVKFGDIHSQEKQGIAVHDNSSGNIYLRIIDPYLTTIEAWQTYIHNEHNKGTPITIWYHLNIPETETV